MENKDTEFINGLYEKVADFFSTSSKWGLKMRRSKLEMRLGILKILTQEPMKLTKLMHKIDLNQNVLKQHLNFLIQQDLVEEQDLGKDAIFYVIANKGLKVLNIIAPTIGEARKSQVLLR